MRSTDSKRKISIHLVAMLVLAAVFLAVGLGTLGTARSAGEGFELKTAQAGDAMTPSVVFSLTSSINETYVDENGETKTRSVSLRLKEIWVNAGAIYSEMGTPAGLKVEYSSSADKYFSHALSATLENGYTVPAEDGSTSTAVNAQYTWAQPFDLKDGWRVSTYRYVRLTATTHDLRLNEVYFVGVNVDDDETNGTRYIVPAQIESATPRHSEESADAAKKAAGALLDAQPTSAEELPQTSFYRFSKEEYFTLLTLDELAAGDSYTTDVEGVNANSYHGDRVNGILGTALIALGARMFGVSPFGIRFFPMLASFGIMVIGYFFVKNLTKNEKAALAFSVLYALCSLSFSLGHTGTPLLIGAFFLLLGAMLCHSFYARGMRRADFLGALPLLGAGLSCAAAICVNGAYLLPVLGVVGLFAAGMVRQQKAKARKLSYVFDAKEDTVGEEETASTARSIVAEYRYKNLAAPVMFGVALIVGTLVISLLCTIPLYPVLVKLFGNPVSGANNVIVLGWKAFAGGFAGVNGAMGQSAWSLVYLLFEGTGEGYAATVAMINPVALLLAAAGVVYAIVRIVMILVKKSYVGETGKEAVKEIRALAVPLAAVVICLVTASFCGGALGMLFLAYVFAFLLAVQLGIRLFSLEGMAGKCGKAAVLCAAFLLAVCFGLWTPFTFSIPVAQPLFALI